MKELTQQKCVPCEGGVDPIKGEILAAMKSSLDQQAPGWTVIDDHELKREFKFADFKEALAFTNKIGELAEAEGHHPDILLTYGKVGVTLSTHAIGGLSNNDFVLAAKISNIELPA